MHTHACVKASTEPSALQSLHRQLATALGPGIGIVCRDVDGDPQNLWPVERAAILKAVPRRQREFAAGRAAAREAMAQIGWPANAIPSAPDRSPVWPEGLTGSIAHSGHVCVAIAGRCDQVHAAGIDIEEDLAVDPTLWESICTPWERAAIARLPPSDRGRWATWLFCAKEAFYKWQYPQTGRMLDFSDVQVRFRPDHSGFSVYPAMPGMLPLLTCSREGHLLTSNGMVLAWLIGPPATIARQETSSGTEINPPR